MAKRKVGNFSFTQALSRFRTVIANRVKKDGRVSAVDLSNVLGNVTGSRRGAIIRRSFESLIEDGVLRRTRDTVYNTDTHHAVAVYERRANRR
jgi:hypothetical protein